MTYVSIIFPYICMYVYMYALLLFLLLLRLRNSDLPLFTHLIDVCQIKKHDLHTSFSHIMNIQLGILGIQLLRVE